MCELIVFEDGEMIKTTHHSSLWHGLFSKVETSGYVIKYLQKCLPKNSICVVPRSDGDIRNTGWQFSFYSILKR
jgi:hypothetical protein